MTRDACTADVDLGATNMLRRYGGLAFHKAYNIQKNLFSTPFKGYIPFDNLYFESLAFLDEVRED